jgi:excisionase family DNA binding protein
VFEDVMTTADVAALLGVNSSTVRGYAARGSMPAPDGHFGRTPYWKRTTVEQWIAARPGQGRGGGRPRSARTR